MNMAHDIRIPFTRVRMGRFLFLLTAMLLAIVLGPFLSDYFGLSLLMKILFTAILISAVYAAGGNRKHFITALILAVLTAVIRWMDYLIPHISLAVLEELAALLFFGYMVVIILMYIFRQREVTFDLIVGSICGYFLLGLLWGSLYTLLETSQPGSFLYVDAHIVDQSFFNYYSFVTLTTLGYGDITPLTPAARSFSILQAVAGQLYIAILISRLVGIHIAQTHK